MLGAVDPSLVTWHPAHGQLVALRRGDQGERLESGNQLQVELVDGAIVLRPTKGKQPATRPEKVAEPPVAVSVPTSLPEAPAVAKRPRGRPRKVPVAPAQPELLLGPAEAPLPSPKRKPGRPRKVVTMELAAIAEPEPGSALAEGGVWKLRPKAELPVPAPEPVPLPPRRAEPSRTGGGYEREERRPFRNVEVRKLGPGRRHNRPQRGTSPSG